MVGAAVGLVMARRYRRVAVTGRSMAPAYLPGDWLVVDRWAYRRRPPRPGEVVVARDPRDSSKLLLKRVAAVEADGRVWVEGDNAAASTDSRAFGAVGREALVGRVVRRYWRRRTG